MGSRTGFHAGEAHSERAKISDIYVNERQFIKYEDFNTTYISGTAAAALAVGTDGAPGIPVYAFTKAVNDQVNFRFVAPASLKRNEKPQFRVYWTRDGGSDVAGAVTWMIDYWVTSVLTSGVESSGRSYNISGAAGITGRTGTANANSEYNQMSCVTSGVIQETVVPMEAKDVAAGDLVRVQLSRYGGDEADDLDQDADLIGVLIEYVDG